MTHLHLIVQGLHLTASEKSLFFLPYLNDWSQFDVVKASAHQSSVTDASEYVIYLLIFDKKNPSVGAEIRHCSISFGCVSKLSSVRWSVRKAALCNNSALCNKSPICHNVVISFCSKAIFSKKKCFQGRAGQNTVMQCSGSKFNLKKKRVICLKFMNKI